MKWFLFFALLTGWLHAQTDLPIRIEKNKQYKGTLFSYGDQVIIDGGVDGDVTAILADVTVSGRVNGNISVLAGNVVLQPGADIQGKVVCLGGNVQNNSEMAFEGNLISLFSPKLDRESRILQGKARASLFFFKLFCLFLALVAMLYFFPNQVRECAFELSQEPWRVVLAGLMTCFLFAIGLLFSFLLMAIAIGIPVFLVLVVALILGVAFGQVGFYFQMSQALERRFNGKLGTVPCIWLVILTFGLLSEIPVVGALVQASILVLGLGVVVLSRFGTNKAWFTRKKKVWAAD
ncbi:MAG: polymer-forming cytoskeletal protein [Acidobacteria bacterium]|nr:polymer-forming cytoskeletal protein [Acidobacteriota bacterium]MCB9398877.1 polymer-forming cytoskeletal protein [Acidobacteriota bacterium]